MFLNLLNCANYWSDVTTGNYSTYLPLGLKDRGIRPPLFTSPDGEKMTYFHVLRVCQKCFLISLGIKSREKYEPK